MNRQPALRQLVNIVVVGAIGIATASIPAHAEQCDNATTRKIATAPAKPQYAWLPKTPIGMDVDATGVVVNGAVALGTFAAAAVALWAAFTDRRTRKKNERVVARLTAAGVVDKLKTIHAKTNMARHLRQHIYIEDRYPTASPMGRLLKSIDLCTFEEIASMSGLPDNCAMKVAYAQGKIRLAAALCEQVPPSNNLAIGDELLNKADDALASAQAWLESAVAICEHATKDLVAAVAAVSGNTE
ncbi:hypothetical protein [Burkholderia glumae]|uniref:hypothetical protein n=1 Tax=Burkholderia glumae TaxID=337 RepID=UPI002164BA92|nr:hypothetical protein [Burkholderia glumae]